MIHCGFWGYLNCIPVYPRKPHRPYRWRGKCPVSWTSINFNIVSPSTIDLNRHIYCSSEIGKHIYFHQKISQLQCLKHPTQSTQVSICEVFLNNSHRVWFGRGLETRHRCQNPAFALGCRNGRTATPAGCPCGPNGLRTISHRASDRCPEILERFLADWSWELIHARIYGECDLRNIQLISETRRIHLISETDIKRNQIIIYKVI